ncbi:MAG: DNA polymerase III subunit gamma/tau, partial [Planctomycetota bacterium]
MTNSTPETLPEDSGDQNGSVEYQVIARRFRPRNFDEVVGQEAVADALRQSILQNRLAHAYLFCGPRGVGKTSMARIFAAALQCPHAKEATPCGECETCQRIFRGEDSDVTEMDGASNRGIDDIRGLIEHVQYAPTQGRYRVFILDEVHMLTRDAFNALLKTLEEPPSHVKFVFATTEPERILPTVLSRCQRCDFSSISNSDISRRLEQICQLENAQPGEGLLEEVALLAQGGMRDAQSMLDQILAFAGKEPQLEDLLRVTGRVSTENLLQLISVLESGDLGAAIQELGPLLDSGTEPSVLTDQLTAVYRDQLHEGVASGWSPEKIESNLLAQEILQETRLKLRQQDRGDLVLELALMRIGTLSSLVRTGLSSTSTPMGAPTGAPTGAIPAKSAVAPVNQDSAVTPAPSTPESPRASVEPQASVETRSSVKSQGESRAHEGGMSRAQAALEALQQKSAKASVAVGDSPVATATLEAEEVTTGAAGSDSAWEDLKEEISRVSSLAARHLANDGVLQNQDEKQVLIVSESL